MLRTTLLTLLLWSGTAFGAARGPVTPNDFKGSDTQRIQAAIDAARTTTHTVTIPQRNANGTNFWMIDEALRLP